MPLPNAVLFSSGLGAAQPEQFTSAYGPDGALTKSALAIFVNPWESRRAIGTPVRFREKI